VEAIERLVPSSKRARPCTSHNAAPPCRPRHSALQWAAVIAGIQQSITQRVDAPARHRSSVEC